MKRLRYKECKSPKEICKIDNIKHIVPSGTCFIVFFESNGVNNLLEPGRLIGPFELLTKIDAQKWEARCRLCDIIKPLHISNMYRQKSCGCKPKHINIEYFDDEGFQYTCRTCGQTKIVDLPMREPWCCDRNTMDS